MAEIRSFTRQGKRAKAQQETFFDYTLLFIVLFLLGFGLVMLYSTSSYDASLQYDGDSAYFLKKSALHSHSRVFPLRVHGALSCFSCG